MEYLWNIYGLFMEYVWNMYGDIYGDIYDMMIRWWCTYPSEKSESQLG